jgi:hypothetical protein
MPTFRRGQMVTAFENVCFSSPEGQIADPVKTQFGYHVVRVDKLETTTLEQARREIEAKLKPEVAQKQMDDLKATAGVTLDEKYFGPSTLTPKAASKYLSRSLAGGRRGPCLCGQGALRSRRMSFAFQRPRRCSGTFGRFPRGPV